MLLGWLSRLAFGITETKLHKLAEGIAIDCHDAVWRRTCERVGQMTANEARGYIRARAAGTIQDEVAQVVGDSQLPVRYHEQLVDLATQFVTRNVLDEVRTVRISRLRRAA